jgi:dTDP-4-dehydrorhamnose 3,5-epimerase-like enzyme
MAGTSIRKKYFYPISGTFVIAWVKIDDFENPSLDLPCEHQIVSAEKSEIVFLPKGYANGIKALEANSELMIFSDMCLSESVNEKIRYPPNWWFDWEKFQII